MTSPSASLEVSPSITPASSSSSTNLPSTPPPPSPSAASTSSSPPPTQPQPHPFSALLTPYSSSPLYPPSPPSPPPPPLSTLRCLLLSSSLPPPPPPPAFYNPQIPQTPYSPPPPTSSKREENIPRSRALCFRRTELTKAEWERERKGVEKWLRWCEGREIVLVSGGESVRKCVVDGGKEAMAMTGGGEFEGVERNEREVRERERERREREVKEREEQQGVWAELREKSAWPKMGKWARGEENYTHFLPLHPPLHSLLTANVKVFTTIESMYSRYIHSFTNGTQSNALKLVWEKSPDAWRFMGSAVQDAWKNAPKNWEVLRKFAEGSVDDGGGGGGGKSSS